jgi:GTPase
VKEQALRAVDEADVILFVVDGKEGVHPLDERLAELLRNRGRPLLLVVNKMDNLPADPAHHDFWRLGLGEPLPVSAISGKGSGDLLDRILAALPEEEETPEAEETLRIAVIGKPNVGKSSFVNRLFGEERMVVSPVPGTTRDAVDSTLTYHGRKLVFVDTAGLRRQSRVDESVEYYSALRTARVIQQAQVCLLLVDAQEGLTVQDMKILEKAWDAGCGLILGVNKWDLVEKDERTAPTSRRTCGLGFPSPGVGAHPLPVRPHGAAGAPDPGPAPGGGRERERRIPTHEVNEVLEALTRHQPPPHVRGRAVRIRYGTQVDTSPPTFLLFSNFPKEIPDHYLRYLMNGFRKAWGFLGVPIRLRLRSSKGPTGTD